MYRTLPSSVQPQSTPSNTQSSTSETVCWLHVFVFLLLLVFKLSLILLWLTKPPTHHYWDYANISHSIIFNRNLITNSMLAFEGNSNHLTAQSLFGLGDQMNWKHLCGDFCGYAIGAGISWVWKLQVWKCKIMCSIPGDPEGPFFPSFPISPSSPISPWSPGLKGKESEEDDSAACFPLCFIHSSGFSEAV